MLTSPFDTLAPDYDSSFTSSALGRSLRELVWSRLDISFSNSRRILELGCGTGEDALHLASRGIEVLATDASTVMVATAERKARERGYGSKLEFLSIPMEEIQNLDGSSFDGTFSNFGAINCIANLNSLSRKLAALLEPGAPLIWVVMGRYVPWEWFWYLVRGAPRKALRRLRRDGVVWRGLKITYPTPAETCAALRPYFDIVRIAPLGCILPPSYAGAWLDRHPRLGDLLARLETRTQHVPPLAWCADHYIIEGRKKETR